MATCIYMYNVPHLVRLISYNGKLWWALNLAKQLSVGIGKIYYLMLSTISVQGDFGYNFTESPANMTVSSYRVYNIVYSISCPPQESLVPWASNEMLWKLRSLSRKLADSVLYPTAYTLSCSQENKLLLCRQHAFIPVNRPLISISLHQSKYIMYYV